MTNFTRALKYSLAHRWTLFVAVSCALGVAVLWGGNITAIYPIVEVVFDGKSIPEWIRGEIARGEQTIAVLNDDIARLEREKQSAEANQQADFDRQLAKARSRREAEQAALVRHRWLQPVLERYLPDGPFQTLLLIIGALLIGTIVKDLFLVGGQVAVARLAERTTRELRLQFYHSVLDRDVVSLGENARGDLMNRFTSDMQWLNVGLQTLFGRAIREPLKMLVCLVGAGLVCWRLLLFSLVVVPLAVFLMSRLASSLRRANRKAMEEMSQIYNALTETLSGIKVVKAFTMERYEMRRFRQTAGQYYQKAMKIARYNSLISPLNELMGMTMISLAILAGAYLAINQVTHLGPLKMSDRPLSKGMLMLFYGLLAGASDPARKLSDVFGRLQQAAAAADRIFAVLDFKPKVVDPAKPKRLPRHQESIVLDDVSFAYVPGQPVIDRVSLRIPFGETVAIVGPNGCGKSTLASLVLRFFDPASGAVRIDGVDVREVQRRELRKQIGLVTQDTLLFDDTVYNNIRYGAPRARHDQVIAAAKHAHAHRFIEQKLNDGYETHTGPGGNRLSGGQRQRIALARAILRDPPILILDEATSQIDLESEQLIHEVLGTFIQNRTTIMVTHRLSTLSLADRILVMDHGRILDVGPHDELLARCDFYRRLYQVDLRASA